MTTSPLLTVANLHAWYGDRQVLRDVTLSLERQCITALIGASGSGKSTFLRSLNRMLDTIPNTRTSGEILFSGENVLNEFVVVITLRRKIGMLFQNPTPFPKSIFDNIA